MYHILICDDEQDIVNALKIYLMNPDFKLFEANTGVQALEVMEREDFHGFTDELFTHIQIKLSDMGFFSS